MLMGILLMASLLFAACDTVPTPTPLPTPAPPVPTDTLVPPTPPPPQARDLLQQAFDTMAQLERYHLDLAVATSTGDQPPSTVSAPNGMVDFVGPDQSHAVLSAGAQSEEQLRIGPNVYLKNGDTWTLLTLTDDLNLQLARVYGVPMGVGGPEFIRDFQLLLAAGSVRDTGTLELIGTVPTRHVIVTAGGAGAQEVAEFWIDPATLHILKAHRDIDMRALGQQVNTIFSQMAQSLDPNSPTPTPGPSQPSGVPGWLSVGYTFSRFNDPALTLPTP